MAIFNGTAGNDNLVGGAGSDTFHGEMGADTLNGGKGNDAYYINPYSTIIDSKGIDTVYLTSGYNVADDTLDMRTLGGGKIENLNAYFYQQDFNSELTIIGNSLSNTIYGNYNDGIGLRNDIDGGAGNDSLYGGSQADTLIGGLGNDFLDGGSGSVSDSLIGGLGNDTYVLIAGAEDIISEAVNQGTDTIKLKDSSFASLNLSSNAMYNNIENIDAINDTSGVRLTGNILSNVITGGSGDDVLNSFLDSQKDTLIGGEGADMYVLHDLKDTITEKGVNVDDNDIVYLAIDFDNNVSTFDTASYTLNNTKIESIHAIDYVSSLILKGNVKTSTTIYGGIGNDSIIGGSVGDFLRGMSGNDTIYGGGGIDTLRGDAGDDTYILADTNDIINGSNGGFNTIKLMNSFKGGSFDLTNVVGYNYTYDIAGISTLDASGVSKGLALKANASYDTTIKGGKGKDTIIGGTGDDIFYGNAGNDSILGSNGEDSIYGGIGNDTILGGIGEDYIYGEAGNDSLLGGDNYDEIYGGIGNDIINGENGDDYLYGEVGNDTLYGEAGDDGLDGGAGNDKMVGGLGNDEYSLNSYGDTVVEVAGEGSDTVYIGNYAIGKTKSFTLAANVENLNIGGLNLQLTASQKKTFAKNRFIINGNAENNSISLGTSEGNYVKISAGDGNDTISSGSWNEVIDGGAGNDFIWAGAGNDTLTGGTGADTFFFGESNNKDFITDTDSSDIIKIDTTTGITKGSDLLFYTDTAGNLYVDYTDGNIGTDVIEIAAGNYNSQTKVELGSSYIHINSIVQNLGSYSGLGSVEITALDYTDKSAQAISLSSALDGWHA